MSESQICSCRCWSRRRWYNVDGTCRRLGCSAFDGPMPLPWYPQLSSPQRQDIVIRLTLTNSNVRPSSSRSSSSVSDYLNFNRLKRMNFRSMNALAVAVTLLTACCALVLGSYTYPQCATNGKGCCEFGTGSMRNRGYVIIALEGDDMVVTCHNGVLRCSYENPSKKASYDAAANVTCPDFTSMMESRSEITYLEGVQASKTATDGESGAGTVKAADM